MDRDDEAYEEEDEPTEQDWLQYLISRYGDGDIEPLNNPLCCDHLHGCGQDQRHFHSCCGHWHGQPEIEPLDDFRNEGYYAWRYDEWEAGVNS